MHKGGKLKHATEPNLTLGDLQGRVRWAGNLCHCKADKAALKPQSVPDDR